jgi:hypothetical protein
VRCALAARGEAESMSGPPPVRVRWNWAGERVSFSVMSTRRFSGAAASDESVVVTTKPFGALVLGAGAMRRIARLTSTNTSDSSMISLIGDKPRQYGDGEDAYSPMSSSITSSNVTTPRAPWFSPGNSDTRTMCDLPC